MRGHGGCSLVRTVPHAVKTLQLLWKGCGSTVSVRSKERLKLPRPRNKLVKNRYTRAYKVSGLHLVRERHLDGGVNYKQGARTGLKQLGMRLGMVVIPFNSLLLSSRS